MYARFNYIHIIYLLLIPLLIVGVYFAFKRTNKYVQLGMMGALCLACAIIRFYAMFRFVPSGGGITILSDLPIFMCGLNIFVLPAVLGLHYYLDAKFNKVSRKANVAGEEFDNAKVVTDAQIQGDVDSKMQMLRVNHWTVQDIKLLTLKRILDKYVLYFVTCGPIVAMLIPDIKDGAFAWFESDVIGFFLAHIFYLVIAVCYFKYNRIKVDVKKPWQVLLVVLGLTTFMHFINLALVLTNTVPDANYFFTMAVPVGNIYTTIAPYFGGGIIFIRGYFVMCLAYTLLTFVCYGVHVGCIKLKNYYGVGNVSVKET